MDDLERQAILHNGILHALGQHGPWDRIETRIAPSIHQEAFPCGYLEVRARRGNGHVVQYLRPTMVDAVEPSILARMLDHVAADMDRQMRVLLAAHAQRPSQSR